MLTVPGFSIPEDIANRALQHVGAERIVTLADNSKNAAECSFVYNRARQAELRDNVWRFAIRRSALRPLTSTSQVWTPPTYVAGTTYVVGSVVSYADTSGARLYISNKAGNIGNTPGTDNGWEGYFGSLYLDSYAAGLSYFAGDIVVSSAVVYVSLVNANVGNTPASSATSWAPQTGTLAAPVFLYPIGAGPASQASTSNVYPLPYGWLFTAPQEPKSASNAGLTFADQRYEGRFIITRESQPIVLRYVADIAAVYSMTVLFCEALAARVAMAVCEVITQSAEKMKVIGAVAGEVLQNAKTANEIETGIIPVAGGFSLPEDIANRALQHIGVERISSFSEVSRNARETQFCYDKLRQAELRGNVWRFAIRRSVMRPISSTTKSWVPTAYVAATTYAAGAVVSFDTGAGMKWFISLVAANTGNTPGITAQWDNYFGPQYADTYSATQTYNTGEVVYIATAIYLSLSGGNIGNAPAGGAPWLLLSGTLAVVSILYPISCGPAEQTSTKNIYPLPNGWLLNAPQEPKAGAANPLIFADWQMEDTFVLTQETQPIVLRFIADATNVVKMDALFCEALAARIAIEVCESLAPAPPPDAKGPGPDPAGKIKIIEGSYAKAIGEAKAVTDIEVGALPMTGGFRIPEDLANRALQYVGAERISSFSEGSKNARETQFCYDKLRQAELRRNNWNFAIQRRTLCPISLTTQAWTPPAYVAATTYPVGAIVSYDNNSGSKLYLSNKASNTGNIPGIAIGWEDYFGQVTPDIWVAKTNYYAGDLVLNTAGTAAYISLLNSNQDAVTVGTSWVAVNGTLAPIELLYPVGAGPTSQAGTANVFPLPVGFLRIANQAPHVGQQSIWGAPSGAQLKDWLVEGRYIVAPETGPIMFRFVGDVTSVLKMDAMFCEGLSARIAMEVCPSLSLPASPDAKFPAKDPLRSIAQAYQKFMVEARLINGIEAGPEQSPEDDFITCRL